MISFEVLVFQGFSLACFLFPLLRKREEKTYCCFEFCFYVNSGVRVLRTARSDEKGRKQLFYLQGQAGRKSKLLINHRRRHQQQRQQHDVAFDTRARAVEEGHGGDKWFPEVTCSLDFSFFPSFILFLQTKSLLDLFVFYFC